MSCTAISKVEQKQPLIVLIGALAARISSRKENKTKMRFGMKTCFLD